MCVLSLFVQRLLHERLNLRSPTAGGRRNGNPRVLPVSRGDDTHTIFRVAARRTQIRVVLQGRYSRYFVHFFVEMCQSVWLLN